MNRKQRNREQNARLLAEAYRSEVEPGTGKVRCLSCGNVFGSFIALASHLQKHNGINSVDFKPSKIVGSTQLGKLTIPVPRPVVTQSIGDFIQPSLLQAAKQQKHGSLMGNKPVQNEAQIPVEAVVNKGNNSAKSRTKLSATKRSVLVNRVLSLQDELESLKDQLQDSDLTTTMKKRQVQGRQKSVLLELHHALVAINQKLSIKQLIMLEFLTNSAEADGELQTPAENNDRETEIELFAIYEEIGRLFETMELSRHNNRGPLFIKKPVFDTKSAIESGVGLCISSQQPSRSVEIEKIRQEKEEEFTEEDISDSSVSSEFSSDSDNDLIGFGDVLSQWAKKAQFKVKSQTPVRRCGSTVVTQNAEPVQESEVLPLTSIEPKVQVVHTGIRKDPKSDHSADSTKSICHQTVFIRPHLMERSLLKQKLKDQEQKSCSLKNRTVKQENPKTLDEVLVGVLRQLNELQQEELKTTKSKKWMISGFSEVLKALKKDLVIMVILANGLDASLATQEEAG
eukprot:g6680.t1